MNCGCGLIGWSGLTLQLSSCLAYFVLLTQFVRSHNLHVSLLGQKKTGQPSNVIFFVYSIKNTTLTIIAVIIILTEIARRYKYYTNCNDLQSEAVHKYSCN